MSALTAASSAFSAIVGTMHDDLTTLMADRWGRQRSSKTTACQAKKALAAFAAAKGDVPSTIRAWREEGLSPSTINTRLSLLKSLGADVAGHHVKRRVDLKWWPRPEVVKEAAYFLTYKGKGVWHEVLSASYLRWAALTGLRVEETLRLRWSDFNSALTEVTVPGTKTLSSQATLALHPVATAVLVSLAQAAPHAPGPWSGLTYDTLAADWAYAKGLLGISDRGATLKSFRRAAARFLHVDCGMPLVMVRDYLRHTDIETTMGYLRVTGGMNLEEQRRYFK